MAEPSLVDVQHRLNCALAAVYDAFDSPVPAKIEGCPCCIDTRNVDILLSAPLKQISGQMLWRYVSGAFYTIGDIEDFRYFLPRILDISINDPSNANDPEIVLNKLRLAGWKTWSASEYAVLAEFLDAWFESALSEDLAEVEEGWLGTRVESVICGASLAGFSIAPWLSRLTQPSASGVFNELRSRFPNEMSAFWDEHPEGFREFSLLFTLGET
jgi:hypothetical protein